MRSFVVALLSGLALAGCAGAAPPETSPASTTGVVAGRVVAGPSGAGLAGAIVTVEGTSLSTRAGSTRDFVLTNVPAGALALHISAAPAISARFAAGALAGGETVTLTLDGAASTARAIALARVRGTDALLEGPVEPAPAGLPANTIIVGGRSVTLPAGSPALTPGMRVRVTGSVNGASIVARVIVIL